METSQLPGPRGLILYPENREFVKKLRPLPAWPTMGWSRIFLGAGMVLCIILGLIFFSFSVLYEAYRIRNQGITVQGILLDAQAAGLSTWVKFEYVYNQRHYTQELDLYAADYDRIIANQDNLSINILPHSPDKARVRGYGTPEERRAFGFAVVGVPFTLLSLVMLIGVINDRDQKALLAKKGRMVRGEIVRYETSKMPSQTLGNVLIGAMAGVIGVLFALILQKSRKEKPKPQRRTKIRYQFTSPASGKVLSKTEKFVGDDGYLPPDMPPGTQVAVYYRTDRHFKAL